MKPTPHHIYVDDNLLADIAPRLKQALAAGIESTFTILGLPALALRRCPIALDKWVELFISYQLMLLGLIINTRTLTVAVSEDYLQELRTLLQQWHSGRRRFTLPQIEKLAGKLARLGQGARWIYHLLPCIYASIAYAIKGNAHYLHLNSAKFRSFVATMKNTAQASLHDNMATINFAIKESSRMVHHAEIQYPIVPSLRKELDFIISLLQDTSVRWATPIAHIIPRTPSSKAWGDASFYGGGGFSISLRFWWHITWPQEVLARLLNRLEMNRRQLLISINVLEFMVIIINYAAATICYALDPVPSDPYPVLLNMADNVSAVRWANHYAKNSLLGRELGRLFMGLLMASPVGINSTWLDSYSNKIADEISRLREAAFSLGSTFDFDFATLQTRYPELRACRRFLPSSKLLSLIWNAILHDDSPDPNIVRQLKPCELGEIIS